MSDVTPWAWVVLAASFGSMFFNSAFFAVGVIHIALIEKYPDVDVGTIAWLGSLYSSMFALTVFVGSIVINLFNARTCVMLSGVLTLVGFTLSSFVTDIKLLFFTYSLIAGSGQAMSFAGSMVIIGYYFKGKTGIATGIATSGSGLCTFVFPPLTQYFVDTYGLSGAFLFLGGLGFQSAVCGSLMRPTKFEKRSKSFSVNICRRQPPKKNPVDKKGDISCYDIVSNKSFSLNNINQQFRKNHLDDKTAESGSNKLLYLSSSCGQLPKKNPLENSVGMSPGYAIGSSKTLFLNSSKGKLPKKDPVDKQDQMSSRFLTEKVILFTSAPTWLLFMSSAAFHMALSTVFLFLPDYFKHLGSSSQESAFILSIAGITGIFSRVLLGFLASTVDTAVVYGSTFGIMGVITFFVKFMNSLGSKIAYTALLGFYTGGSWALQYTLLVTIVGLKNASTGYGIMMFFSGMGYLLGPPFGEMMVVWFNDYYYAFVFAGLCFLVAAGTGLLIRPKINKQHVLSVINIEDSENENFITEPEKQIITSLSEETLNLLNKKISPV
ncbi:hypothetical protein SNE40_001412 [Patella caerulea]|uniref:Major facilitator superfamily (MFS) profile domain-containing protein n=1 Tax=Patella caerulea TaxID=87958 RepID=A0AAN8K736_PATCE